MAPLNGVVKFLFSALIGAIIYHNAAYFSKNVHQQDYSNPVPPIIPPELISLNQIAAHDKIIHQTSTPFPIPELPNYQSSPPQPPQVLSNKAVAQVSPPQPKPKPVKSLQANDPTPVQKSTPASSSAMVVATKAPLKITKRAQEFLPEYNPCCDTRAQGRKPGKPDADALIKKEDKFLADHARRFPYPIFSGVHKCFNNAEAYTAGWLAKKSMIMGVKFEVVKYDEPYDAKTVYGYPVRWGKSVNMEAVTHNVLAPLINKIGVGAFKTLDAFDFSIEHLSLYERRLGVMSMTGELKDRTVKAIVDNLAEREMQIRKSALRGDYKLNPRAQKFVDDTIVLMPFYGVAVGTGHSVVSTRFKYLNLTFWSHYRVFPHIGVVVGTEEDLAFVKTCGVPWAEIVNVIGQIDMPKNMGVASGVAAAQKFRSGAWDKYEYMYWTESDQVLVIREDAVEPLYELVSDGQHLVVPHRLLPFPRSSDFDPSLAHLLKNSGGNKKELKDNDEKQYHAVVRTAEVERPLEAASCCFDPGDCTRRDHWVHFSDNDKMCMMRFGDTMGVVNGEANIFLHTWRTCKFSETREECPRAY